jgi:hypothetical protein
LYTAEADRTIISRGEIFSTTWQNMDSELQWTKRGREKKSNVFFSSSCTMLLTLEAAYALSVNTLSPYAVPVNTLSPHVVPVNILMPYQ